MSTRSSAAPSAPSSPTAKAASSKPGGSFGAQFTNRQDCKFKTRSSTGGPEIVSYAVAGTTATVLDVPNGVYYVRVHALNAEGESPASNEVVVAVTGSGGGGCTSAPNAPHSLIGNANNSLVTLSWTAPTGSCGVTSYSVQAGSSPGASDVAILNVGTATTFSASAPAGIYYIRVVAVNSFGGSLPSNEVTVTVGCPSAPNAPTSLNGASVGDMVRLDWAAAGTGCTATSYSVHAGSAPGLSDLAILNVGAATSLSVSAPPGSYYVRVVATNDFGASMPSNEIALNVTASNSFVIGFSGLAGLPSGSPVVTYTESGFTVTPTGAEWSGAASLGFTRDASEPSLTGDLTITSGGAFFTLSRLDVYSSATPIPLELIGLRHGQQPLPCRNHRYAADPGDQSGHVVLR